MTVANSTRRVDYVGDGSTTLFAIPFKFFAAGDIVATLVTNSSGAETSWALTTNFTLTSPGDSGTLTAVVAPASGTTLIIERVLSYIQSTNYIEGDEFPQDAHEDALDRLTMLVQQFAPADLVAGHIRAGNRQLLDGDTTTTAFDVDGSLTEGAWESVGPTSGIGNNDWAELDVLPDNAKFVIVDAHIVGTDLHAAKIYATVGSVFSPAAAVSSNLLLDDVSAIGTDFMKRLEIPLGLLKTFKLYYTSGDGTENISLYYRGFITE